MLLFLVSAATAPSSWVEVEGDGGVVSVAVGEGDDVLDPVESVDDEPRVEVASGGGTDVVCGLFSSIQVTSELSCTLNGLVLPPVPYGPASDMMRITSAPASMLTVQLKVRREWASFGTGTLNAVPPNTIPCNPTGL
jgi:hypothetical protein